jgi:hypothetical protein
VGVLATQSLVKVILRTSERDWRASMGPWKSDSCERNPGAVGWCRSCHGDIQDKVDICSRFIIPNDSVRADRADQSCSKQANLVSTEEDGRVVEWKDAQASPGLARCAVAHGGALWVAESGKKGTHSLS